MADKPEVKNADAELPGIDPGKDVEITVPVAEAPTERRRVNVVRS